MKHKKILGLFGIFVVLSLLLALIPASPAAATGEAVLLSPTSGKVGTSVTITGYSFTANTTVAVYFSNQVATAGLSMGTSVTNYTTAAITGITATTFAAAFTVPTYLTTGGNTAVTAGTYYLYFCYISSLSPNVIVLAQPFTVVGNPAITLSPTTGAGGSSVTITGTDFTASTILQFVIDGNSLQITGGQTSTLTTGGFSTTVTIPATTTAGAHTITATAGTTASATFTATAAAALDTLTVTSATPGTAITISGSNYPANTALVFKLDSTTMTRQSGSSSTNSGGFFSTTVAIPASATAGAHTITVSAGTATASASFTVISPAILNDLAPNSGRAGTDVTVSGTGFGASTALVFKLDSVIVAPKSGDTTTQSGGSFSTTVTIPSTATVGAHTISVTAGSNTLSKTFTVNAPATSVNVSANGDNVGASIVIAGTGFQNSATVTVTYDGVKVASGTTGTNGLFVTSPFEIPASTHGNHIISITDGINTENVTFTVESTPPAVPVPLAPAMGATLKSPYLFDWADVTDPSAPVTYELQIATTQDFSSGSIVIDKTGLKESQYKLTDSEALQLSGNVPTYYWRERASDAASNASAWTGAGQFKVAKPFKFTGWPLYVTMVAGAIVFFLLGLWLGRRSAFSY